jgi:hypothetical protein
MAYNTACSVHPTGGTAARRDGVRVFKQVAWLEVGSVKAAFSRPAHRWADAVGANKQGEKTMNLMLEGDSN